MFKEAAMQKIDKVGRVKPRVEDHMAHSHFCHTRNIFIDKWHKSYRAQTGKYGMHMFCCQSYSARRLRQPVLSQHDKFNLLHCSNILLQFASLALSVRSDEHKQTLSLRMKQTVLGFFQPTNVTKH